MTEIAEIKLDSDTLRIIEERAGKEAVNVRTTPVRCVPQSCMNTCEERQAGPTGAQS